MVNNFIFFAMQYETSKDSSKYFSLMVINFSEDFFFYLFKDYSQDCNLFEKVLFWKISKYFLVYWHTNNVVLKNVFFNFVGFILSRAKNLLQIKERGCSISIQFWNVRLNWRKDSYFFFLPSRCLFFNTLSCLRRVCSIIICFHYLYYLCWAIYQWPNVILILKSYKNIQNDILHILID